VQATIVRGRPPRNAVVYQETRAGTRSHRGDTFNLSVSDGVAG
jgi:beta-lactam-binding protein with PASTA domain